MLRGPQAPLMFSVHSGGAVSSVPKQPRMRWGVGRRLLCLLQFSVLLTAASFTATAQTTHVRLGALEMVLDGRAPRAGCAVLGVRPASSGRRAGDLARHVRSFFVMQTPIGDLDACEALARAQLESLYDEPRVRTIDVESVQAVEARAHTRCRNLTPAGAAICIPYRGFAYLLVDRIAGCQSGGLMLRSTADWLDRIVGSIRFPP